MKFVMILSLLAMTSMAFSYENFGVEKKVQNKIKMALKKDFHEFALSTMNSYNKSRSDYRKDLFKRYIGEATYNQKLFPSTLPKMYYKDNSLVIPKIGFKLTIKDYLSKTFSVHGKNINISCKKETDCFLNLLDSISQTKKTTLLNFFIQNAYANETREVNQRFTSFIQGNDTTLLAALIKYNNQTSGSYGQIKEYDCSLFCSDSSKDLFNAQLFSRLNSTLGGLVNICESNSNVLGSSLYIESRQEDFVYGSNTQLGQLLDTLTGDDVLNIENRQEFLSDYVVYGDIDDLSEDDFQQLGCEELYNTATKADEIEELSDSDQERIEELQREIAEIKRREGGSEFAGILDRGRLIDPARRARYNAFMARVNPQIAPMRAEISQIRGADAAEKERMRQEYCGNVATLKGCLADYYTFRNNSTVVNTNETIKDIRVRTDQRLRSNSDVIAE